jgi:hypothetical protein
MSSVGHLAASGIVSAAVRFARCYHLRDVCIRICVYMCARVYYVSNARMRACTCTCMHVSSVSSV